MHRPSVPGANKWRKPMSKRLLSLTAAAMVAASLAFANVA
jgi:hypothetical protein